MLWRSLLFVLALVLATPASAGSVSVLVDISDQKMYVRVEGYLKYAWDVSTARRNYRTPVGSFHPTRMYVKYYSSKYHGSPMPHSIFFYGGYAIHGTSEVSRLGTPASHGCIRLDPKNAKALFSLVKEHGAAETSIRVRA